MPIRVIELQKGNNMNSDADKKDELQEMKVRIEKLIRAIIKEVVEEENDKDRYCA